jgi:Uma2 family endonuclease
VATVGTTSLTADQFFDWVHRPENQGKYWELERGEVIEMPSPGECHGVICALITYLLSQYVFQRRQGYVCSNDTGFIVEQDPDTVRGPDVMVFDQRATVDKLSRKYTDKVPRLIVEVLSPSDQQGRTSVRVSQYLHRGVPLVWVVDPEVRIVTLYRPGQEHRTFEEGEELTGEDVLPDLRLPVTQLFTLPGEKP